MPADNEPQQGLLSELLALQEPPEPGVRVTIEFLSQRKRYGMLLPAVQGVEAGKALADHLAEAVRDTVLLHTEITTREVPQ